eukprot:jgi/Tetstr1/423153/TSEL_013921.t1
MRTASTAPAPTTSGQPAAYPQSRLDCEYTSCYCEENIYRLTQRLQEQPEQLRGELFVVFLSNPQRMMELWCQRIAAPVGGHAVWDYHVILLQKNAVSQAKEDSGGQCCQVWDLDSTLPFPVPLPQYRQHALKPPTVYPRWFRVIPADVFLRNFASDRSHMVMPNGEYAEPPPPYTPLVAHDGKTNTLDSFLDMSRPDVKCSTGLPLRGVFSDAGKEHGVVLSEAAFLDLFDL